MFKITFFSAFENIPVIVPKLLTFRELYSNVTEFTHNDKWNFLEISSLFALWVNPIWISYHTVL